MYQLYNKATDTGPQTWYEVGDIVTYIGQHEYHAGIPVARNTEPTPWKSVLKYKIVKRYVFNKRFVYEILSDLNHDWATDTIVGYRLRNEEEYARYVQDWHNNHLCKILAEE
jgi:hypothetical protein